MIDDRLMRIEGMQREVMDHLNEARRLRDGDGGGTSGTMDQRVTRLETHMEYVRKDLGEIKADLKTLVGTVSDLPTKDDLAAWKVQWTALVVAAIAIVVGGIIGGLAWIKPDPAPTAVQPFVIQVRGNAVEADDTGSGTGMTRPAPKP